MPPTITHRKATSYDINSGCVFSDTAIRPNIRTITGEVKLSIQYKQHALTIMVMHVKGLVSLMDVHSIIVTSIQDCR